MSVKTVRRLLLVSTLLLNGAVWADSWNIGILAMRGEVFTRSHWQPLEAALNQQLPDQQVEALLREVRQHPQQRRLWLDVKSWLIQHRFIMGGTALALLLLTLNHIWVMLLVRRRGRQLVHNAVQLREKEQSLQTARQMSVLGEMTSGFAHELNQPLSAIRHYAQGCTIRLQKQDRQHPLLPALEHIDQQAQRGADTLRNLRHWVSQAQGKPMLADEWEQISVRQAIDHVWQWLRVPQQFPQLLLNSDVDRSVTLVLPPVLLEQVLANLILNSAQAGAKMLWLSAVREATGVRITLQDNGGGIDASQLDQAFQPFKTSRKEGMGLGLVICQRLVRYGRGEISIINQTAPDGQPDSAVVLVFNRQEER